MKKICLAVAFSLFPLTSIAQNFMTDDEIMEKIVGRTLSGQNQEAEVWTKTYRDMGKGKPRGMVQNASNGEQIRAMWLIRGGQFCERVKKDVECWYLEEIDDTTIQAYTGEEKIKLDQPWLIVE